MEEHAVMSTLTRSENLTEEQLLSMPRMGKAEMIDGRLIVAPAGSEHGGVSARLLARLWTHVEAHRAGLVFDSSTGFWMKSGNLLSPDVAFVAANRLKGLKRLPRKFFKGSPDLVAEVLSPNDRTADTERKIAEYFETDTRLMWLVDPEALTVRLYREGRVTGTLSRGDTLKGDEVVPGFAIDLDDLFAQPDFG
jgi:Uma2 family endonuclease